MGYLQLKHVSHHYFSSKGFIKALENTSFSIKEGEFISLLGPSGCGKSTILSIVAGIIQPTGGKVVFNEQLCGDVNVEIGYMLQEDYLFPWKTIMDNILIGPKIYRLNMEEAKEKALQMLKEVQLKDVENLYPDSLSGGMRQRVALVRTLITNPKVLLLDEPFSALDYQTKLTLEDLVFNLLRQYRKTTLLVTHDIGEAIAMSNRIFVMKTNPGSIKKTFNVPIELRNETPFLVRRHPKFRVLFDQIWSELNKYKATLEPRKSKEKKS